MPGRRADITRCCLILSPLMASGSHQSLFNANHVIPNGPVWSPVFANAWTAFSHSACSRWRSDQAFSRRSWSTFSSQSSRKRRAIFLFGNWLAWHRRRLPLWPRVWFELRVAAVMAFLPWERIRIAHGMDAAPDKPADHSFTLTSSKSVSEVEISRAALMGVCVAENDWRFAGYDGRLLRTTTTPAIARLFCRFTRNRRRTSAAVG